MELTFIFKSIFMANYAMLKGLSHVGVSVDFNSKYKIYGVKLGTHGVLIHERRKKVKNKNLHNYSKISTPCNIRLTQVGVEGETHTVLSSRL